ncbi:DUF6503 family protein [Flagellimonas zhangzhouensis]|uniref:GLPGLI family protein n=1 Tax=Flagellimonas zhangzhouensis TaxID=1073328 RepID=A0A1H2UF77_9FLAO|nr:DUF6503 family protein [Allomuricauda zhangzhouensis]SDQ17759.1 hypothetical protein SAMN05216294_0732 [Allomuricauda zhangzhouensis]SDW54538.1 hypothetical protein SAMN04487892_1561 [Allomuricauda zhangzhouensis]
MKKQIPFLLFLVFIQFQSLQAQQETAQQVLEKAIAYHDPNGNWGGLKTTFKVTMTTPERPERVSTIQVDFPKQVFNLTVKQAENTSHFKITNDGCDITLNGSAEFSEEDKEKMRLTCERGNFMKDYYTYLYGLPMKLNDPGTQLNPKVQKKTFKGKEYLVLNVTYDAEVGTDEWYFYFDPSTYAMEVYQFYHDESKNDGEYILLEGIEEINGIKMPKTRAWYVNKDNKYLGTDTLDKI